MTFVQTHFESTDLWFTQNKEFVLLTAEPKEFKPPSKFYSALLLQFTHLYGSAWMLRFNQYFGLNLLSFFCFVYLCCLIEKTEHLIRRMRWKAHFFLQPDQGSNNKQTFGFNSTKDPRPLTNCKNLRMACSTSFNQRD